MKEPIITFETAKLAKERGFSDPVDYFYYDHFGEIKLLNWPLPFNHNTDNEEHWSAPRQSLLQKWLRDDWKIHPYIVPQGDGKRWHVPTIRQNHKDVLDSHLWRKKEENYYDSYEDALEAALIKCLTFI